ncbi:MAG: molybdopterin-guanine dinucleotide biosynthesis protein B [Pseudomonadota bacterium]
MNVYGITGWKDMGKTTLMERVVAEMTGRGLTVSTIKHAHHDTDIDQPGRDSHRHREAGAYQVLLSSPRRWAVMTELRGAPEPTLSSQLAHLAPVDLVLIEGYKRDPHPKIEAYRSVGGKPPLAERNDTVRAVASDVDLALHVPVLPLNDTTAIADFILSEVGL